MSVNKSQIILEKINLIFHWNKNFKICDCQNTVIIFKTKVNMTYNRQSKMISKLWLHLIICILYPHENILFHKHWSHKSMCIILQKKTLKKWYIKMLRMLHFCERVCVCVTVSVRVFKTSICFVQVSYASNQHQLQ